jgi:preprotein translocase subunit SecG
LLERPAEPFNTFEIDPNMQLWITVIHAFQLLAALSMIGLVLIQHGKGADMGASFGSGASGSLFGASGSANFLSRSTAACAVVFFACTLALAFLSNAGGVNPSLTSGGSVLDRAAPAASAPVIPGPAAAPAASAPAGLGVPAAIPTPVVPAASTASAASAAN